MSSARILAADSVIFPSIYLAGALNMGVLNTSVFPDGSLLDASNVMLINGIISKGIGRFAGPIFSRSLIAHLGQKAYVRLVPSSRHWWRSGLDDRTRALRKEVSETLLLSL